MYGQIHCVIRELVQTKFGNEAWEIILKKSKLDEHASFLMFNRYDDTSTFNLVGAVSDTLGVPVETVLEIFGEFFFDYCLRHGYDKMLRTLGSDIKSFIQNLDSLHSLLALSYKGIAAPSFRCEDGHNGELILHYYSGRPGLYPIVKGVLKAVARDLFQQSVEMSIIEQNKEDIGFNQSQEHTAFSLLTTRVQLRSDSAASLASSERLSPEGSSDGKEIVEFNPDTVLLRASDFCAAFPYHIIFDRDLRIRQCGDLIQKHSTMTLTEGTPLTRAFSIVHPKMVISIENIRKFINAVFLLAIVREENGRKTLLLKGQMIWLSDTQNMIFIGSPRLTSLNELMEMNVYLADIPLYDVTRELVLLNQQRIAEIDIAKRLDETTAELKKTSQELEEEKSKTETLLHQMLPRKVADALTHGQKVEAEKFDQVTILFSDIVTFTNIAAACSPMDIVNMLNDMYQRFDARTSQHNVYKVETIGDAYMIVSGVPEQTSMHAQPVANFAMDMVEDAGDVKSPATGLPLQIRVGIHTGPVVAGVVGVKMPRYCLFGDTVNTASRMESHGVPGRIHVSPTTYQALRGWGYTFQHRGEMEVKGKGKMSTYFLCGRLNRRLKDPVDEYSELVVHADDNERGSLVKFLTSSNEELHKQLSFNSENEDLDETPTFYAGSDSEQSPDKVVKSSELTSTKLNRNKLEKTESEQSVDSSKGKLLRNKKISRSSNDETLISPDAESMPATKVNDSKIVLTSCSTNTSLQDNPDCVYISGSFKNTYHGSRPTSSESKTKNGTIVEDAIVNNPELVNQLASMCMGGYGASNRNSKSPPSSNKVTPHPVHVSRQPEHTSNSQTSNTTAIVPDLHASGDATAHPALPGRAVVKSETFPPPSPSHAKDRAKAASQNDLKMLTGDSKRKKKKKERSKLCIVS
ncbi:guanylate cyclase soluble subunit beta-2-like [Physella acuta]|uniref:guanylate cyclase soluble subunit beta-2-like n=1 Tax=Physella acuta TaxID=109671 RepID=UPI0027DE4A59|nr:guanylate cyclase soluble subunit beta-2-like [Physella acuta]